MDVGFGFAAVNLYFQRLLGMRVAISYPRPRGHRGLWYRTVDSTEIWANWAVKRHLRLRSWFMFFRQRR